MGQPDASFFSVEGNADVGEIMEFDVPAGAALETGARLLSASFVPVGPRPTFHVTSRMAVDLTFGTSRFPARYIAHLVAAVRNVLGECERYLAS